MALDPKQLGLAGGTLWGTVMALTTLAAVSVNYGRELLSLMASIYPGYSISYVGIFTGALWGFVDAFIGFYLLAMLYNYFETKRK